MKSIFLFKISSKLYLRQSHFHFDFLTSAIQISTASQILNSKWTFCSLRLYSFLHCHSYLLQGPLSIKGWKSLWNHPILCRFLIIPHSIVIKVVVGIFRIFNKYVGQNRMKIRLFHDFFNSLFYLHFYKSGSKSTQNIHEIFYIQSNTHVKN